MQLINRLILGQVDDKLIRAVRDYKFPNGQPLNITKACYIASEASSWVILGKCTITEFDKLLGGLERLTGYTKAEIMERV